MSTDPTQPLLGPAEPRTAEPAHPVPDDKVHGDDFGDAWLRPTLTAEASRDAGRGSTAPERPAPSSPQRPSSGPYWLVAGLGATLLLSSVAGVLSWSSLTGGISRTAVEQQ